MSSRAEPLSGTGDDDSVDGSVGFEVIKDLMDACAHRQGEDVPAIGVVQREDGVTILLLDQHHFVRITHRRLLDRVDSHRRSGVDVTRSRVSG